MAIVIQCPNPACAASASVSETFEGRGVKCRKCGTPFKATATLDGQPADTKRSSPTSAGEPFASLPAEFGRYQVLRLLGRGGMGAVYLAEDSQLGRQVALKLPHFDDSETQRVERFVREAKAAAGLMHPNICPVFDAGQVSGRPFITMAYIEGKSLEESINPDEPMDPRRAAEVTRTLATALHEAHERGIVHRDLKPANVMVNVKGEPVVMDFGLAKRVAEVDANEAKLTRDGAVMGTPAYMAPEQVKGELERIGPATDVYALGVMLFEMLTGHTPYSGPLGVVMGQILGAPVRVPSELRAGLDPRLDAACRRAMAKEPADRFPDMPAFAQALGEYLKGPAADASPPAPTPFEVMVADADAAEPPAPRAARRKAVTVPPPERTRTRPPLWPFAVGAGLLGLLAVAVTLAVVVTVRTRHGDVVIDLGDAASGVEVKVDGERVELTGLDKPLKLTAGEHGLTVAGGDFETVTQQFTVKKGEKQVVKVTLKAKPASVAMTAPVAAAAVAPKTPTSPTAGAATALDSLKPSFIPDAILAKFYGSRASAPPELVTVYDTARPDTEGYHGMDISPDGRLLATSKFPLKVVYVRDLATGQPVHRFPLPPSKPFAYWLKFSPDGKTLYGIQHEFLLHAWDLEGRELWNALARSDWSDPALSPDGATLITAADGRGIQVLDAKTGAVRSRWPEVVSAGCRLIYSRDGSRVAATTGRSVRVIDPKDGSVSKTLDLDSAATEPTFSRDGTKVYTSHVWKVDREHVNETDIETGAVREYCHTTKGCRNPQIHPSAPLLATVSSDGSVQFWDLTAGPEQSPLSIPLGGGIHRCLFTPDGRHAVAVASSGVFVLRIPLDEGVSKWIARRTGRAAKPPAVVPAPTSPSVAPAPKSDDFTPLFNGKDLTGWTSVGEPKWTWADGRLLGSPAPGGGAGVLMTEADYDDFELTLQYRAAAGAGSGLFLRADLAGPVSGAGQLEVQVIDDAFPQYAKLPAADKTGSVFGVFARKVDPPFKRADWNALRVRLEGRRIQVWVNEVQTIDSDLDTARDNFAKVPGLTRKAGRIALQQNQKADIEFKDVRVRRLLANQQGTSPKTKTELSALTELPADQQTRGSWVSENGLTLYWFARGGADPKKKESWVWTATRKSAEAAFGNARQLWPAADFAVSADERRMLVTAATLSGTDVSESVRATADAEWGRPVKCQGLSGQGYLVTPALAGDGLQLLCEQFPKQNDPGGLVRFTRADLSAPWGTPEPLALTGLGGRSLSFPHVTRDGKSLFGSVQADGGGRDLVVLTLDQGGKSYGGPRRIVLPDNATANPFFPCYCAATRELFFGEANPQRTLPTTRLYVLRNFDPETGTVPIVASTKP